MRKLLLLPLRFFVGWGLSPRLLGMIGVTMLLLLRLTVGWHFYSEGIDKRQSGEWSAAPFFSNARGPLAEHYRQLVWDYDGRFRLNREATMLTLATYREQIAAHYGFDEPQKARAQQNYADAMERHKWVLEQNAVELEEYELGRERIARLDTDARERQIREGVSSLGGQRDTIRREWKQKAAPALAQIDQIWDSYEKAQNEVATSDQLASNGTFRLVKPRTYHIDTSEIDRIVPYFDMAIGVCLLLGFFTPLAALAAAGFLGSVFLSQYPPTTGPSSSMYQLVECMACLVLAGTGAGRFAGLDYFLHLMVRKTWGRSARQAAA